MVVSDRSTACGFEQYIVDVTEGKANGPHSHRRPVAPTLVRNRIFGQKPAIKRAAIPGIRVLSSEITIGGLVGCAGKNRVRCRDGEDGIVRESAERIEEREGGGLRQGVLVD